MPARVSDTFVLRTYPFREADLIVSFLTRDLGKLRGVARRARRPKSPFGSGLERLSQVMTRKVVTCGEAETVAVIMERMTTGKFRHVPVLEQDRLMGIVSIGDVVKQRLSEIEHESAALRDYIQTA